MLKNRQKMTAIAANRAAVVADYSQYWKRKKFYLSELKMLIVHKWRGVCKNDGQKKYCSIQHRIQTCGKNKSTCDCGDACPWMP